MDSHLKKQICFLCIIWTLMIVGSLIGILTIILFPVTPKHEPIQHTLKEEINNVTRYNDSITLHLRSNFGSVVNTAHNNYTQTEQKKIDQASTGKVYVAPQNTIYKNTTPLTQAQFEFVIEICNYYNNKFTPDTIFGIMSTESNFNLQAQNRGGDRGIMQVNKKYFQSYLKDNPKLLKLYNISDKKYDMFDFKTNVIAGYNALIFWDGVAKRKGYSALKHTLYGYNQGYNYFKRGYSINNYATKVLRWE